MGHGPNLVGTPGEMKVEDALHGAGQGVIVEKCLGLRGAEEWEVPRGGILTGKRSWELVHCAKGTTDQ